MEKPILDPLDQYRDEFKKLHNQNVVTYFDDLVKKANINIEENRNTIAKHKKALSNAEDKKSDGRKFNFLRILIVCVSVLFFIFGLYFIFVQPAGLVIAASISIGVLLIALGIVLLVFPLRKINKKIKMMQDAANKYMQEAEALKQEAYTQMIPLNKLYDWNISSKLVEKTIPLIQMDQFFDIKKFEYLKEKYGFTDNQDERCSTCFVQSGSIKGNPFLIVNTFNQVFIDELYQGSIIIHWTTRESDGKGGTRTVTHTQTLIATINKPKPSYFYDTVLVYGNDAAPNLTFYRGPSGALGKDEKGIEKLVKNGIKALEKQAEKAISEGKQFTMLGNEEFDVLFGATDRDNEVEFRLLFTPLGQQNMLELIKNQEPFGDDFKFKKMKNLNYIMSSHSQRFNYRCQPEQFYNFDYDEARKFFIDYNNNYFSSLYFDLAPILAIPLYQQMKPKEYIYRDTIESNIPSYEHEAMANNYKYYDFKHPEASTDQILKTSFLTKSKNGDFVRVRSHAFKAVPQVEYVQKMGGDGRLHTIPVQWYRYDPVFKDTDMEVSNIKSNRNQFEEMSRQDNFKKVLSEMGANGIIYERGLVSMVVERQLEDNEIEKIKKLIEKESD